MSTVSTSVSGSPAYVAAHRMAVVDKLMSFEDAYLLGRFVHERLGGPMALPARKFMTVAQAKRLTAGGWVTMDGSSDVSQPVLLRYASEETAQYPFEANVTVELLQVELLPAVVTSAWMVEVTEEGLFAVLGRAATEDVEATEEDDLDDEEEYDDEEQPQLDCLGDLEDVARSMATNWINGSEFEWIEWAWWHLTEQGLTTWDDEDEYVLVVARLGVLGALVREFSAHSHDEGTPGHWRFHVPSLVGEYPLVSILALGVVAGREGLLPDRDGYERENEEAVLREVIRHEHRRVVRALMQAPGQPELFASLWCVSSEARYPITAEQYHDAVDGDVGGWQVDGYQWVEDGMVIDQ